jgi:hypothetical protein
MTPEQRSARAMKALMAAAAKRTEKRLAAEQAQKRKREGLMVAVGALTPYSQNIPASSPGLIDRQGMSLL